MLEEDQENLRCSERLKDNQVYLHVEGLAKKVRKAKNFENKVIDADVQKREIDVFYKVGWQYQHHHSSMTCDISDPLYVHSLDSNEEQLRIYYQEMNRFIYRLKKQHEDETAFRVELRNYLHLNQIKQSEGQNLLCAKTTYQTLINVFGLIIQKYRENFQAYNDRDISDEIGESYWDVKKIYIVIENWIQGYQDEIHNHPHVEDQGIEASENYLTMGAALEFMTNFASVADTVVNQKRSALFNYQPMIKNLTYLVHPVLLGIYTFYRRQKILWENQYEHDISKIDFSEKGPIDKEKLPEDIRHLQISKVAFINLDGYQSQFNIQLAKNMDKHLLYISFPKFENDGSDEFMPLNNRFFKKILYNYTQEMYEFGDSDYDVLEEVDIRNSEGFDDDDRISEQQERDIKDEFQTRFNPEKYFETVSKFSTTKMVKNKNIYILPISFKYLQNQLKTLFKDDKDVSKYASYFIWFLIRDFVGEDIKKFNPKYIAVSYSGKIKLIDSHFVRIMQELAEAAHRKVIFYPNFTANYGDPDQYYDNQVNLQTNFMRPDLDLMRKFSQFLKINSGTYNLEPPHQKQPILSKYKTAKVNNYILGLLKALSEKQYDHLKNRVSQIFLKSPDIIISRSIGECKEEIQASVHKYYRQLYEQIRLLLTTNNDSQEYSQELQELIVATRQNLREISENDRQGSTDYLVNELITNYYLQTSSQKLSEFIYLYIKSLNQKQQFEMIKEIIPTTNQDQNLNYKLSRTSNNINGFYSLSVRYQVGQQRRSMPIYQKTQIVYKTDQRHKTKINGKKLCNVMIMNYIDDENGEPISYSGHFQISESKENVVQTQRLQVFPIKFRRFDDVQTPRFVLRTAWNYAETARYYILYWPLQYNLLEAKLNLIDQKKYQPRILNEIYVASIPSSRKQPLVFNLTAFDDTNLQPRKHCSAYQMHDQDKIFIFGGFYDKQNNYLNLQTDITGLDFQNYDPEHRKCIVTNQKGDLYNLQALQNHGDNEMEAQNTVTMTNNSLVRARRQYGFYELEELCDLTEEEQREQEALKTVYMIGGYGQNFLRPYSLMSCQYFEIKIDRNRRCINSIQRRMVYDRVITSNIRGFIKNKGSFRQFPTLDGGIIKQKYLAADHYIAHRSVYKIQKKIKDNRKIRELGIKTKYFFGLPIFSKFRKTFNNFACKIGEGTPERNNEATQISLMNSYEGNHYLLIARDRHRPQMKRVQLEITEGPDKLRFFSLTHNSIISIDIKNKSIFAVILHEYYTKNQYILAECQLKDQNTNEIVLKPIYTFPQNISQYSIFSPRKGEVLLLHGVSFHQSVVTDYVINFGRKERDRQKINRKKIECNHKVSSIGIRKIVTAMMKDQSLENKSLEVKAINLLLSKKRNCPSIGFIQNRLKMDFQFANFVWQLEQEGQFIFEQEETKKQVVVQEIDEIRYFSTNTVLIFSQNQQQDKINDLLMAKVSANKKDSYIADLSNIVCVSEQRKIWKVNVSKYKYWAYWDRSLKVEMHEKNMHKYQLNNQL